jgi:hypothetical protein
MTTLPRARDVTETPERTQEGQIKAKASDLGTICTRYAMLAKKCRALVPKLHTDLMGVTTVGIRVDDKVVRG